MDRGYTDEAARTEPYLRRIIAVRENALGPAADEVVKPLGELAELYAKQKRYADAEGLLLLPPALREKAFGPDHDKVVDVLKKLTELFRYTEETARTEPYLKRVIAIQEKTLGPAADEVVRALGELAQLYAMQRRYGEAIETTDRAIVLADRAFNERGHSADSRALLRQQLSALADVYESSARFGKAVDTLRRIVELEYQDPFAENASFSFKEKPINRLIDLYRRLGRFNDAERIQKNALAMTELQIASLEKHFISKLDYKNTRNNLLNRLKDAAEAARDIGNYKVATLHYERYLEIVNRTSGADINSTIFVLIEISTIYRQLGYLQKSINAIEQAAGASGHYITRYFIWNQNINAIFMIVETYLEYGLVNRAEAFVVDQIKRSNADDKVSQSGPINGMITTLLWWLLAGC